jgi:nucleotide-binding universal stress UspA family protein
VHTHSSHMVVGFDGDIASRSALSVAADLALRIQAHLHVVHVINLRDFPIDPDRPDWEEQAQVTVRDHEAMAAVQLSGWPGQWTYHNERGDAGRGLSAVADQHDALMIVVGTHGEGFAIALQRLLAGGSVAQALVRHQARPILVVPVPQHAKRQ